MTTPAKRARPGAPGFFSQNDLAPLNLLAHPIWIFDIERKCMWWANDAAVSLWNAESIEDLLERDFATDMSESTEKRINGYLDRFRMGETFSEQVRCASSRRCLLPCLPKENRSTVLQHSLAVWQCPAMFVEQFLVVCPLLLTLLSFLFSVDLLPKRRTCNDQR